MWVRMHPFNICFLRLTQTKIHYYLLYCFHLYNFLRDSDLIFSVMILVELLLKVDDNKSKSNFVNIF